MKRCKAECHDAGMQVFDTHMLYGVIESDGSRLKITVGKAVGSSLLLSNCPKCLYGKAVMTTMWTVGDNCYINIIPFGPEPIRWFRAESEAELVYLAKIF